MSDRNELSPSDQPADASRADAQASANRLRRHILKAGAAAVPTIISLQSGTAWALSSCASRGETLPTVGDMNTTFGNPNAATQDQTDARDRVTSLTGGVIDDADISSIVTGFSPSGVGNYPEGMSVNDGDVIYLAATNSSCWTSFCAGPIAKGAVGYTPGPGGDACNNPPP